MQLVVAASKVMFLTRCSFEFIHSLVSSTPAVLKPSNFRYQLALVTKRLKSSESCETRLDFNLTTIAYVGSISSVGKLVSITRIKLFYLGSGAACFESCSGARPSEVT